MRPIPSVRPQKRNYKNLLITVLGLVVIIGAYIGYAIVRPVPGLKTTVTPPVLTAQVKVNIPWPAGGQAAFGAQGYGLLAAHGTDKQVPTASVAKVITALAVLDKHPLKPGETGPAITITAQDVALYNQYAGADGSVVPVFEGQKITEYQALQAMMLPSANNVSDSLAIWAFGSLPAYTTFANSYVKTLGMDNTTIGTDASGFSPSTVSTAADLVRLGNKALANPVLADIVGQPTAVFPDYGTIENVNAFLGRNGIRGIKTGNTDEAGGCYLAAADIEVGGQKITVITAIMGSNTLGQGMRDSIPMIQSAVSQFQNVHVVRVGQSVGRVTSSWGENSDIVATQNITTLTWAGTSLTPSVHADVRKAPAAAGTNVGSLNLNDMSGKELSSPLQLKNTIEKPTIKWRLLHPV
jgi:D-alanyl-D-alanine carboxypeptidase (penicillin-binding protein 5/6)